MTMIIGTNFCRPGIWSFFITKTITPWLSTMAIIKWSHGQQLCTRMTKIWQLCAKMTKVWVVLLAFFSFFFLGCLSHLCLCKHHHTMLIFGKEKRKKKWRKKNKRQWSGCVVPLLLDRFLGGANVVREGSWKNMKRNNQC
jgi:hypothetical protein